MKSADLPRLLVIERILRDRQNVWQQIVDERDLNRLTTDLLASSAAALAAYGAVLGFFHGPLMALTSAIKLPLLFLITLAICLPTLYLFNLVFGARLSVRQAVALVMVAITVTAMLALAFAPISLFFLITSHDYGLYKLLNVAILALSAFVGLRFLTGGMHVLDEHGLLAARPADGSAAPSAAGVVPAADPAPEVTEPVPAMIGAGGQTRPGEATTGLELVPAGPPYSSSGELPLTYPTITPLPQPVGRPARSGRGGTAGARPASMTLLYIWIILFGFVGTQLAWTLRPFFGDPGQGFALFRSIDGNFYADIVRTIAHL
ncbi:MAG TPA: hypothetical protein VHI50_16250 [Micromonosporaceae bacterium]|nr:hypothetical protein [Micromonosporaceae bacterium]